MERAVPVHLLAADLAVPAVEAAALNAEGDHALAEAVQEEIRLVVVTSDAISARALDVTKDNAASRFRDQIHDQIAWVPAQCLLEQRLNHQPQWLAHRRNRLRFLRHLRLRAFALSAWNLAQNRAQNRAQKFVRHVQGNLLGRLPPTSSLRLVRLKLGPMLTRL